MAPPVHTILGLTPELFDRDVVVARTAAASIAALLRRAPIGLVVALDRAFRDAALHRRLGLNFIGVEPVQLARLARLGPLHATGLMIASLVRDGHVRELAVRELTASDDPLALAFLMNRLNDYVGAIAGLAWTGLERRLQPANAATFVHCLPLLERMGSWVRAAPARRAQLRGLLLLPHPLCRQALWAGVRGQSVLPAQLVPAPRGDVVAARSGPSDAGPVLPAAQLLTEIHRGEAAMQDVLSAALAARDIRTRRWAARAAIAAELTPRSVLLALAPTLERDRSAAIRAFGLQARALHRDRAGIERACFDPRAAIRYRARAVLADMFEPLDYRGVALATLAAPPGRGALIAALGILGELGRVEDTQAVAAYAADPRARVAREARRTLESLRRIGG